MCEEKKGHEHAFLKINRPEQCPSVIFTVVDENMPKVKPDIEQNIDNSTFFRVNQGVQVHCAGQGEKGGKAVWQGNNMDIVMGELFGKNVQD
jgi:hypothetical protein